MEQEKRKRAPKVTVEQKQIMVNFIEKNEKMVKGKFSSTFTASDSRALWAELGEILNSCNGAKKTGKDWRKCWQNVRRVTKSNAAGAAKYRRATGGGEAEAETFTSLEEKISALIPDCTIIGHEDVAETYVILSNITVPNIPATSSAEEREIQVLLAAEEAVDVTAEAGCSSAGASTVTSTKETTDSVDAAEVPASEQTFKTPCKQSLKRKRISSSVARLQRATSATNQLAEIAAQKLKIKEKYYKQKLELAAANLEVAKTIASSLAAIANHFKTHT